MSAVVADTHTVLWHLSADPRLSLRARAAMERATDNGERIFIPNICLVEATYLTEKNRIEPMALANLGQALRNPHSPFEPIPLTVKIAFALREIPRVSVPDLPDRVIAATALSLGLPLVTRDAEIRAANIQTIW